MPATQPPVTPCKSCPLRKEKTFRKFDPNEAKFVASFKTGELRVQAGTEFLIDGTISPHFYTVLRGWALRSKTFSDGRRQILNFAVAGDLLGLQSSLFSEMSHSVEALTDMTLCTFSRKRIWELFNNHPSLAYDVTWLAAREEKVLGDQLANLGRRSAYHRLANLLLLIFIRARFAGLTDGNRLEFPLTQVVLADATGLSQVYANRTLQRLRASGLLSLQNGVLIIHDEPALRQLVESTTADPPQRPFI